MLHGIISIEQSTLRDIPWLSYSVFRIKKEFFRYTGKKQKLGGGMEKKQLGSFRFIYSTFSTGRHYKDATNFGEGIKCVPRKIYSCSFQSCHLNILWICGHSINFYSCLHTAFLSPSLCHITWQTQPTAANMLLAFCLPTSSPSIHQQIICFLGYHRVFQRFFQ